MRARVVFRLSALSLALWPLMASQQAQAAVVGFKEDPATIEAEVLAAFNAARANPGGYVRGLQTYRTYYRANVVTVPGTNVHIETNEGAVPVDEAIAFLGETQPMAELVTADSLRAAALDHVREQGASGETGHFSADGSAPGQRSLRHGGSADVAEVIAYGSSDAADVIRQLIIDDGVSDRGHRTLMFAAHLRYVGVACGPHPEFRTMCVIDMADTPDGKPGDTVRTRVRVATADGAGG